MIARLWRVIRHPNRRQIPPSPFVERMRGARSEAITQSRESLRATRKTLQELPPPVGNFMEAELLRRREDP